MKLNHNSLSAKIYRWFYATSTMPSNLCPYFWKLVVALVFGLPVFLITLPVTLLYRKDNHSFSERLGISIVVWIMVCGGVSALSVFGLFWKLPQKDTLYFHLVGIGIVCWLAGIVFGGIELFKYLKEKYQDRRYRKIRKIYYDEDGNRIPEHIRQKEEKANIIVEMVKATYHKYCPKIDWN